MNFIKKHKKEFILLTIVVLIILFCGIAFAIMWFSGNGDRYGDRLDGIEKVELKDSHLNDVVKTIKDDKDYVTKVSYHVEGKLVSFLVTVKDDTNADTAKEVGNIVKEELTKDELAYYDVQLFLLDSNTNKEARYPLIGYKHKTSDVFTWSNN